MLDATRKDIERYLHRKPTLASAIKTAAAHYGLRAILVYRLGAALKRNRNNVVAWPMVLLGVLLYLPLVVLVRRGYGIHLDLSATIGPGFYIGHFGGVKLVNCSLGPRCSVNEHTKIGRSDEMVGPKIGEGVWVGGHAQVFGPVAVGDGATIGAGAIVTQDIAARSLAMGAPARIIAREYDNSKIM